MKVLEDNVSLSMALIRLTIFSTMLDVGTFEGFLSKRSASVHLINLVLETLMNGLVKQVRMLDTI